MAETAADALAANGLDPRTGLKRRDSLFNDLDGVIRTLAEDRQGAAAFLTIAIDDVAHINLNFGYDVGDRIIAAVIQRISRRMRAGDVLGHMSGHKFGAILKNCSETALAVAAERFRSAIADNLIDAEGTMVQASISIGAVVVPRHAGDAATAALRAEEALADLRSRQRTGFQIYSPSAERDMIRRRNVELADQIAWGLANDRFVLAYQPVVDASTRTVRAYEALSRLVLDDGLVISAGPLIETAERLGLVNRIDLRTLALVLEDLAANPDLKVAVNASVETLHDPLWFATLVDALRADRSIAPRLTVEITETAAMRDLDRMLQISQSLRDLGCSIAIDDFGTGHTSFNALRRLEVNWLKIDGSYIRDICTNPDSLVFTRTMAQLAGHFGFRTVAEWVRDEPCAELLTSLGIDALQGEIAGAPLLRVTPRTEAILAGAGRPLPYETPGAFAFSRMVAGPLSVGAPASGRAAA